MASTYPIFVAFVMPSGARVMYSTAVPAAASDGTYYAGDIIYNMTPSASGTVNPIGWVCTVGGSPGTFDGFGGVSAGAQLITASGAISPSIQGNYIITKAGVAAMTLAAPASTANGLIIEITSGTAYAHTITATGLLNTGTASVNVLTFAAYAGASVRLMAYNSLWNLLGYNTVTLS